MVSINKQQANKRKQDFLLSFFNSKPVYQEKEINGFWLIKTYNGDTENWQVSIYTQESYKSYKKWRKNN